jgi:hypothetical protein
VCSITGVAVAISSSLTSGSCTEYIIISLTGVNWGASGVWCPYRGCKQKKKFFPLFMPTRWNSYFDSTPF